MTFQMAPGGYDAHEGGLSVQAGHSTCYYCDRDLVAVVIPAGQAHAQAFREGRMTCGLCALAGLPTFEASESGHENREHANRRRAAKAALHRG